MSPAITKCTSGLVRIFCDKLITFHKAYTKLMNKFIRT